MLAIMATVATGLVMSMGGNSSQKKLIKEAQRFRIAMTMATDRAMLTGEELGLLVAENEYQFVRWQDTEWIPITNDKALQTHQLSEEITLELSLEGLDWEEQSMFESDGLFEDVFADDEDEEKLMPQVFIYSFGEFTDFSLEFTWDSEDDEPVSEIVEGLTYKVQLKRDEVDE